MACFSDLFLLQEQKAFIARQQEAESKRKAAEDELSAQNALLAQAEKLRQESLLSNQASVAQLTQQQNELNERVAAMQAEGHQGRAAAEAALRNSSNPSLDSFRAQIASLQAQLAQARASLAAA